MPETGFLGNQILNLALTEVMEREQSPPGNNTREL